jgi:Prolipoprotein diacylglyceryl transferase
VFGVIGAAVAIALAMALASLVELTPIERIVLVVVPHFAAALSFELGLRGFGRRSIVFYEKAAVAVAMTALAFACIGGPTVRGAELAMLGVGAFLAIGRIGCFNVGCCHGKRARRGVRYSWDHAHQFPKRWIGVTLFPIQLVDAAASAAGVVAGVALVVAGAPAGAGLVAYLSVYAPCRFGEELFRGDPVRRETLGLSEAQWISSVVCIGCVLALPVWWTILPSVLVLAAAALLVVARRVGWWPSLWLLSARHLAEIDRRLARLVVAGPPITTSEGLTLRFHERGDDLELSVSRDGASITPQLARGITRQLGRQWTAITFEPSIVIAARVAPEHRVA